MNVRTRTNEEEGSRTFQMRACISSDSATYNPYNIFAESSAFEYDFDSSGHGECSGNLENPS